MAAHKEVAGLQCSAEQCNLTFKWASCNLSTVFFAIFTSPPAHFQSCVQLQASPTFIIFTIFCNLFIIFTILIDPPPHLQTFDRGARPRESGSQCETPGRSHPLLRSLPLRTTCRGGLSDLFGLFFMWSFRSLIRLRWTSTRSTRASTNKLTMMCWSRGRSGRRRRPRWGERRRRRRRKWR